MIFCVDCDFHENPLFLDYDMRPTATSQVTIFQEHNLMQEHKDIIEPQEEEYLENEPAEHGDEGWNAQYPKTAAHGKYFRHN